MPNMAVGGTNVGGIQEQTATAPDAVSKVPTALIVAADDAVVPQPAEAMAGYPHMPSTQHSLSLYFTASASPLATPYALVLGNLTGPGNTIFDGRTAGLVIINGTNQPVTSANLSYIDTIGGVVVTITYVLPNVSIAAGGGQQRFRTPMVSGVLKTAEVVLAFAAAPASGTVTVLYQLHGPGALPVGTMLQGGSQSCATGGQQIVAAATPCQAVLVQNDPASASNLLVGGAGSQTYNLVPSAGVVIAIDDASKVYGKGATAAATANWQALW